MRAPIPVSECWGKLAHAIPGDRSSPVTEWHPLVDHCADVAACCVALLGMRPDGFAPTIINRRLAQLGGLDVLDHVLVARLGVLAGLHDLGKCNRGFQQRAQKDPPFQAGHIEAGFALLPFGQELNAIQRRFAELLPNAWDDWAEDPYTVLRLLAAALGHHGEPGRVGGMVDARLWESGGGYDPFESLSALVAAVKHWPLAYEQPGHHLPSPPAFQHGFAGLVQLGDWLGSDRRFFDYSNDLQGRWPLETATEAITALGLDGSTLRRSLPDVDFLRLSGGRAPRPAQEAIGRLPLPDGASTLLLEDETGAGKTEAALWWFVRLFAAGLVDGLYFALPTRTAAMQIEARISAAVRRLWTVEPRPVVVLAVPGYLRVDDADGLRLPGFDVHWDGRPHPERWAAEQPKRFLAGVIVVGTIDQVLLSALKTGHSHLRATCLLRHLLVVDEVHASDAYMTTILEQVLAHHRAAGGHALLMSATLGSAMRARLLERRPGPDLQSASTIPYPLLSRDDGPPPTTTPAWAASRSIRLEPLPIIDDAPAITARAIEAARQGARVLIVRNTVAGCLAVFNALLTESPELLWRCRGVPAPHHARFAREDREALDRALESCFGTGSPSCGLIACATQTVQQALDIDADLLISDLCPADVLLQRLGRLHRHRDRHRPSGFHAPRALVLGPAVPLVELLGPKGHAKGRHGLGAVYADLRMLDATWRLVADGTIRVPDDNRRWIETITHPEALATYAQSDERWIFHAPLVIGTELSRRQLAEANCCDRQASFGGDSSGSQRELFRDDHLTPEISTRLGTTDRVLDLPPDTIGPFGVAIRRLTLPGWWLEQRGVQQDAQVGQSAVEVLGDHLRIVYAGCLFRYDTHGLRPDRSAADDEDADA